MRSMKGFVFTIDAVFALIIASIATSLLLYINFYSPIVYGTGALDASGIEQSFLGATIGSVCQNIYITGSPACTFSNTMTNVSFGGYQVSSSDSVLQALAALYLTQGAGPYATLIMERLYPSYNAGIYINDKFGPAIGLEAGNFTNGPAFYAPNSPAIAFSYSISQWFYLYSQSSGNSAWNPITDIYNGSSGNGIGGGQNLDYGGLWAGSTSNALEYGEYWPANWQFCVTPSGGINTDTWYNVAVVVRNYNNVTVYINGKESAQCVLSGVVGVTPQRTSIGIGDNPPGGNELANAIIANVQVYNTALAQSNVTNIYREGITGAPVATSSLIGWWPLDGNANDYSTNGNNGTFQNAAYTTKLAGNYLPASLLNAYQVSKATAPSYISTSTANVLYNTSVVLWH